MKKSKTMLAILLVLAMTLSIAACSSGGGNSTSSTDDTQSSSVATAPSEASGNKSAGGRTIRISEYKVSPEVQAAKDKYFLQPLKEAFPNDTINFEVFTDTQSLQVQIAGGSGPDIVGLSGPAIAEQYAKANRIVDLTPYAEKYKWADLFYDWAWNVSFYDNKLYSLPNAFEGMVMYYNTDVFKANGWSIPTNETELVDIMKKAQAAGIIPISFGNSNYQGAVDWLYSTFLNCNAGPDAVKEALEGKRQWTDPLFVDSINKMVSWWQKGYIGDKRSQAITTDDMVSLFASGKAAMMIDGTWQAADLQLTYPDCNWEIGLMPELRSGVGRIFPLAVGGCYAINASTKEADFAAEVLNWIFTSTDRHLKSVREANFQPYPIKAVNADSLKGMDARLGNMYGILMAAQASGDIGYCDWTFFPNDVMNYMNENTDALFLGSLTTEEYLAKVQEYMDKAIKEGSVPPLP